MKKLISLSILFILLIIRVNAQFGQSYIFTITCNAISEYELTPDEILLFNTEASNITFVIEDDIITYNFNGNKYVYDIYAIEKAANRDITKYICENTNGEDIIIIVYWEDEMVIYGYYNDDNDEKPIALYIKQVEANFSYRR